MWTDEVKVVFQFIMCSVTELDAIFIQALGYFHSKNPGTSVTLKSLVNDSVEKSQRYVCLLIKQSFYYFT